MTENKMIMLQTTPLSLYLSNVPMTMVTRHTVRDYYLLVWPEYTSDLVAVLLSVNDLTQVTEVHKYQE